MKIAHVQSLLLYCEKIRNHQFKVIGRQASNDDFCFNETP